MNKTKAGYIEGLISVIVNSVLFALKFWAGIVTGSIALTADAWHTLSDSLSSVIVIAASKLSSKKPDVEHPFGHGRWEFIASFLIALILGIIAFDFLKDSLIRLNNQESTYYGKLAIVVTIISIVVKEGLAQYAFYIGKKTNNTSVVADGWHHRTDALSSIVVLAGILFAKQFWWIDSVLGIIISGMLFHATYVISKEAISNLLGEKPDANMIEEIIKVVKDEFSTELYMHHFNFHNYVNHKELTFHIRLNKDCTIEEGHLMVTDIERIIKEKFNVISTIHIEPILSEMN